MPSIVDIQDLSPRIQYTASAAQTVFPYPFPIFEDDNLVVYDEDTLQVLTTDYTVSGAGDDTGGNVTFTSGRTAGNVITIYRDIPIERTSDFQTNGPLASASFNDELDRITLVLQQLESSIGRALRIPKTANVDDAAIELTPLANWLSKYVFINANGEPEPADFDGSGTAISQSVIAAFLNPQTPAEQAAGVDPPYKWYPFGHALRYETLANYKVSATAAFNQMIAIAAQITSGTTFYCPALGGAYRFLTQPNDIASQIHFRGDGKVKTQFNKAFTGAASYLFHFTAPAEGSIISDLAIVDEAGTTADAQVKVTASVTTAGTMCVMRNVRMTTLGTNTHDYAVHVDGSARVVDPVGVRVFLMEGCDIFGGALGSVLLRSTMGARMIGCNTFDAGGTTGRVRVHGDATVPAYYTRIDGGTYAGFDFTYTRGGLITVGEILGAITNTVNTEDVLVLGECTASVQTNWTRGLYLPPRGPTFFPATRIGLGGVLSTSFALEAIGAITGRISGSVTNVGQVGVPFSTSCPTGQSFTITTTNILKDIRVATAGGAAVQARGDFKTAAMDLYDPSNEFENSAAPAAGQTGISKPANSNVVTITNNVGGTIVYTILVVGNVSSVTDPA